MAVHIHHPNTHTGRLRQEDFGYEASLGYMARPYLKKNELIK
jgi:hypothetical protein